MSILPLRSDSFRIASAIPGRIRLQFVPSAARQGRLFALAEDLRALHAVEQVEVVSDARSLILRYHVARMSLPAMLACLEATVAGAAQPKRPHNAVCFRGTTPPDPEAEVVRARSLLQNPETTRYPLLFPGIAIGLSLLVEAPLLTGAALLLAALPTVRRAWNGLRQRRPNVDQLDLAALLVLVGLGDLITGSLMIGLISLGDLIQARTARQSRRTLGELMAPSGQRCWVEREGSLVEVSVEQLAAGDIVHVHPGDQIPADGFVAAGKALVDLKMLTGESAPVLRRVGEKVFALTTIVDGRISVRVEQIGRETRAGRVAALIEEAPLSDTRIQNYAAKIGDVLVLPIFALAGAVYAFTGSALRAAAVLILDFATGIRVSAPTAILSAMTAAARQGLFIKGGKAMEQLARVDAVVFDKTGTLTCGRPVVTHVCALNGLSDDQVLQLAAAAEAKLKHPAAAAIVAAAQARGLELPSASAMEYSLGLGVRAEVQGRTIHVGSERYLRQSGISLEAAQQVRQRLEALRYSLVFVAAGRRLVGLLAYHDPPRLESALVIQALKERGVKRIVMLTGDNLRAARPIAASLGITDMIADAYPEQKAEVVQQLRSQGFTVAVVGDGVNDTPAFTRADVSISLPHGADVAREVADIILLDGDLWGLPRAMDRSREALGILRQNLNLIVGPTAVGLTTAVLGWASPIVSTIINNGTTVLAGLNSLRPLLARSPDLPGHKLLCEEEAIL